MIHHHAALRHGLVMNSATGVESILELFSWPPACSLGWMELPLLSSVFFPEHAM